MYVANWTFICSTFIKLVESHVILLAMGILLVVHLNVLVFCSPGHVLHPLCPQGLISCGM